MTLPYKQMADAIRILVMDGVENAGSGHPGMAMGMADVMAVLASCFLKFNPLDTQWADRDRLVLSAGHGAMLLYATYYLLGVGEMTLEQIKAYRKWDSLTPGHPEYHHTPAVEVTTGPLGQGVANAVGMALAEKLLSEEFGSELSDHYTYVIAGDGCLMEGISYEALSLAGHWNLSKLIVLFDDNRVTIDGSTDLSRSEDVKKRFESCGFTVLSADGHDHRDIKKTLQEARDSHSPCVIMFRTQIGYGAPSKMGHCGVHGSPLGTQEISKAREFLNWPYTESFFIPQDLLQVWRTCWKPCTEVTYQAWQNTLKNHPKKEAFCNALTENVSEDSFKALEDLKKKWCQEPVSLATRSASGMVIKIIYAQTRLLGGAADLKESTCTGQLGEVGEKGARPFIYYGIREHAMAAIMNGLAAHKGYLPYGGTFLVFSDYARPAIRLSALMKLPVIYVMTHDSIGLGEDGPTHQPVEHLIALRAIPNLQVLRPADAIETTECWEMALRYQGPSLLCLSRQALPSVRHHDITENLCAKGAYVLETSSPGPWDLEFWATGSEVSLAKEVATAVGRSYRIISAPCWEAFFQQPVAYQKSLFSDNSLRVSIEAGSTWGWDRFTGEHGLRFGLDHFGASGKPAVLYHEFGLSVQAIREKILNKLP